MDTLQHLRRRRLVRELLPTLLLPIGAALLYVGLSVGMTCTSYVPFTRECWTHDYAVPGYATALLGVCFALVGLGSFLARGGRDAPLREPPIHVADPVLADRVDRWSRLAFVALVGLGMAIAEAFPIYSLALQTMAGPQATFSPAWFAADLVLFALADFMVLFVVYAWTGTE